MNAGIAKRIIKQEKQILGRRLSLSALNEIIDSQFMKMSINGNIQDKLDVIRLMLMENTEPRDGMQFKLKLISDGVVLLTYVCNTKRCDKTSSIAACSSIWREKGKKWRLMHHQEAALA